MNFTNANRTLPTVVIVLENSSIMKGFTKKVVSFYVTKPVIYTRNRLFNRSMFGWYDRSDGQFDLKVMA